MHATDVVVRMIDYAVEDPQRPQAGPRYRLIITVLAPGAAPAADLAPCALERARLLTRAAQSQSPADTRIPWLDNRIIRYEYA